MVKSLKSLFWIGLFIASPALAEEGLYPISQIQRLATPLPRGVLEQVVPAVVSLGRMGNSYGTGAVVSPDGLVLTNYHVIQDFLEETFKNKKDFELGLSAQTPREEIPLKNLLIYRLQSDNDVTALLNKDSSNTAVRNLEAVFSDRFHLHCQVQNNKNFRQYRMLCYKKYADVRLVALPKKSDAATETENLNSHGNNKRFYHFFDFAILRIYEAGVPLKTSHFQPSLGNLASGERIYALGFPARTNRFSDSEQLKNQLNFHLPALIDRDRSLVDQFKLATQKNQNLMTLNIFDGLNIEQYLAWLNQRTIRFSGQTKYAGKKAIAKAQEMENRLLAKMKAEEKAAFVELREKIRETYSRLNSTEPTRTIFSSSLGGKLFLESNIGQLIARISGSVSEGKKEMHFKFDFENDFSREELMIKFFASHLFKNIKILDPGIQKILSEFSTPEELANGILYQSKIAQLVKNSSKEIKLTDVREADDRFFRWGQRLALRLKELNQAADKEMKLIEEFDKVFEEKLTRHGLMPYPDADGSLRISTGRLLGFQEIENTYFYQTRMKDLKNVPGNATNIQDFHEQTALTFFSDIDASGGNSGGPVFNSQGRLVGIHFGTNDVGDSHNIYYDKSDFRGVALSLRAILDYLFGPLENAKVANEILQTEL